MSGELYAGFGLARDIIAHTYLGKPLAPRDYDFAVIGSEWTEAEARAFIEQYGKIVRRLDMVKEVVKPSGNVFAYPNGFVLIAEINGQQLDFKFFKTLEDAHIRGIFDVEKILFPMRGESIEDLVERVKSIQQRGELPGPGDVSDPYKGIEAIIRGFPKTINWGLAKASPLDWVIRGAMIYAKMGRLRWIHPSERELMIEAIKGTQYVLPKHRGLFNRAVDHRQSYHVREILADLGFFEQFPRWRWNDPVEELMNSWVQKSYMNPWTCQQIYRAR